MADDEDAGQQNAGKETDTSRGGDADEDARSGNEPREYERASSGQSLRSGEEGEEDQEEGRSGLADADSQADASGTQEDEAVQEDQDASTSAAGGGLARRSSSAARDSPAHDLSRRDSRPRSGSGSISASGSRPTSSRPMSAYRDLRGSRPNSAAIAAQIEGFDDDFVIHTDDAHTAQQQQQQQTLEHVLEDHMEEDDDGGPTIEELIARAQQERQELLSINESLQKRTRLAMEARNKGRPAVRDMSRLDGIETRYRSALKQWTELVEERTRTAAHYEAVTFEMKATLEERIKRADDISQSLKHFKQEVARAAEHSKTGKPISAKLLASLEQQDEEREEIVQSARLKNIHLAGALRKLEGSIRAKEELAEGLHLIDFEQLKMENQSLNEKIEERNEELLKLRKKTTTTVQILTHLKEKLQFVEKENAQLTEQLGQLDEELGYKRDGLQQLKTTRDMLRTKGLKIKESSSYITNDLLLDDLEIQRNKLLDHQAEVQQLEQQYHSTLEKIERNNLRMVAITQELTASGNAKLLSSITAASSTSGASKTITKLPSIRSDSRKTPAKLVGALM